MGARTMRWTAVSVVTALVLVGGAVVASASPREQGPEAPPEREADIVIDVDALAHSIADLPDPLPVPPDDGQHHCQKVGARPSAFPLFDGETLVLPARWHAELCGAVLDTGPHWTLTWAGLIQDPEVPGTGGMLATGLWTLGTDGTGDRFVVALGNLDDGRQFSYAPLTGADPDSGLHHLEGRYLDRSHLTTPTTPLVVDQTTTTATASPGSGTAAAAPAQAVAGAPVFTG